MPAEPRVSTFDPLTAVRGRIDDGLFAFLAEVRTEIEGMDPAAALLVDEIIRLLRAGGKRLRPLFCYLGYRAAGRPQDGPQKGPQDGPQKGPRDGPSNGERLGPILRAAGALELLHTMALIHDDLMDAADERRGAPASALRLTAEAAGLGVADPERTGVSLAILAGDLAAVLADRCFLTAGFPPERSIAALRIYAMMRTEMAAGQAVDVLGTATASRARRAAMMRGGTYTVSGPLSIGAELAEAAPEVRSRLERFGRPLSEAFQLLDDRRDRDRPAADPALIQGLLDDARSGIDRKVFSDEVADGLERLLLVVMAE